MRNKSKYTSDWNDTIRPAILKRDNYKCQDCGVIHRLSYSFDRLGNRTKIDKSEIEEEKKFGNKAYQVFLQVAHLDHNPNNNDPDNLKCLCVKCHLNNDRNHRILMRKTKTKKI